MKASRHRGRAAPEEFSFPPDRFSQGEPLIGMTDDGVGHCPAWQCILCVDGLISFSEDRSNKSQLCPEQSVVGTASTEHPVGLGP